MACCESERACIKPVYKAAGHLPESRPFQLSAAVRLSPTCMMQGVLGSALANAAQLLLPASSQACAAAHNRSSERTKSMITAAAVCTAALALSTEAPAIEMFQGSPTGSVCCPPRSTAHTRRAVTPAHCIAPHKTRRCASAITSIIMSGNICAQDSKKHLAVSTDSLSSDSSTTQLC